jgi:hypothetical protein
LKKIRHTEDEKLHLQLNGELNQSYRKNLRIFTVNRLHAGISAPYVFGNFNNPK